MKSGRAGSCTDWSGAIHIVVDGLQSLARHTVRLFDAPGGLEMADCFALPRAGADRVIGRISWFDGAI